MPWLESVSGTASWWPPGCVRGARRPGAAGRLREPDPKPLALVYALGDLIFYAFLQDLADHRPVLVGRRLCSALYPLLNVGLVLLVRSSLRVRAAEPGSTDWPGGLARRRCWDVVFLRPVLEVTGGSLSTGSTDLAYPSATWACSPC